MEKAQISVNLAPPMFLLFLTFMVLKLCKVITWSWFWVTAPLWGSLALGLTIFVLFLIFIGIVGFFAN